MVLIPLTSEHAVAEVPFKAHYDDLEQLYANCPYCEDTSVYAYKEEGVVLLDDIYCVLCHRQFIVADDAYWFIGTLPFRYKRRRYRDIDQP